ncbi:MAG TPA: RNA polymerase sigma factor, partial [Egibacteraceae bacterium]|nr:RNA polymerase sigma factor [Egibacteraceae bacterium]
MATAVDDMVSQHDAVLVDRHRAGDRRAFGILYDAHYGRLLSYIRRRVREGDLVEDIAQEAFVKAFAAMGDLRETGRFYPWLTAITRRLILDHYKARVRVIAVPDLDAGQSEPADEALMQRQTQADLAAALLRVRARHQQVLWLREHEGLSYQDIALRLGIPETAVAPLLFRARKALQREYLAITQQERSAVVVPALLFLADAARRLRDRLAAMVPYLPEPAALTSSMAAVALSFAAVVGGGAEVVDAPRLASPAPSVSGSAASAALATAVDVAPEASIRRETAQHARDGGLAPVAPYE